MYINNFNLPPEVQDPTKNHTKEVIPKEDAAAHLTKYLYLIQSLESRFNNRRNIKAPKIDFDKPANLDIAPIEIKVEGYSEVPSEVLNLLLEHYARISTILGLDRVEEEYYVSVEDLPEYSLGVHIPPMQLGTKGVIQINLKDFLKKCQYFEESKSKIEKKLEIPEQASSINIFSLIEILAHELYHKRQYAFFRHFYASREKNYQDSSGDMIKYRNQIIEIGARAFAKRYIEYLQSQLDESDDSYLATCLRNYRSFEDFSFDKELIKFIPWDNFEDFIKRKKL